MPSAMPAELAEKLSDVPAANDQPNFADTEDLHGVVANALQDPIAQLFCTRDEIRVLQRSEAFGDCVNTRKALDWLMKDIDTLERALYGLWEDS
jgi:hypothetical protein